MLYGTLPLYDAVPARPAGAMLLAPREHCRVQEGGGARTVERLARG